MKNLYILIGNIGSGKSTFAKEFIEKYHQDEKIVCIERDSLRYMIGKGKYVYDEELEPAIISANLDVIRAFMKIKVDIIVDEVNMSRTMRRGYLALGLEYGYKSTAIIMPWLDIKTSVDRRMKNNHGSTTKEIWEIVYDKFSSQYEQPTIQEGFDEIKLYMKESLY